MRRTRSRRQKAESSIEDDGLESMLFEGMSLEASAPSDIREARVLAMLGDSVTTDHISPAGSIAKVSPAGKHLIEHGVDPKDFNLGRLDVAGRDEGRRPGRNRARTEVRTYQREHWSRIAG